MAAILENGCQFCHRSNLRWPYSQISPRRCILTVCQISCFYHQTHNHFTYLLHYIERTHSIAPDKETIEGPHYNFYHLPPGFLSLRKEEPLPELFPQTPVPSYSWPRSTQVADKIVSPYCFRSSLPPCPFSWCPLCHSFSPPVVVESCNVSRPSMYSLLGNVYDIIIILSV